MLLDWRDLSRARAGQTVRLTGWLHRAALGGPRLLAEQPCCLGCPAETAAPYMDVSASVPLPSGMVTLEGVLALANDRWRLVDARPVSGFGRRRLMQAAPLLCLAAGGARTGPQGGPGRRRPRQICTRTPPSCSPSGATHRSRPLAGPMREGGLAVTSLAIVSDAPTHRVMDDGRIHPFRDPAPGELYVYSQRGFARLHRLAQEQGLPIIATAAQMRAARSDQPSVVVSAEGADFLEGNRGPGGRSL